MKLLIIRHALALELDEWAGGDFDRPLHSKGEERFKKAAKLIAHACPNLDLIFHSPYRRTCQTAEILSEATDKPALASDCLALESLQGEIWRHLSLREENTIALIGHEPSLSSFVSVALAGSNTLPFARLKKGSLVVLNFPGRVLPETAELLAYVPPRLLREAASDTQWRI